MRHTLVILLLFTTLPCLGQSQSKIQGKVVDDVYGTAISEASLWFEGSSKGTTSDEQGEFELTCDESVTGLILHVSHINYKDVQVRVSGVQGELQIRLRPTVFSIDPVDVLAERLPEVVYGSEVFSVADYAFCGDSILVLAYEKRLTKASRLYLLDEALTILDSLIIPDEITAQGIEQDYAGILYLRSSAGVYQLIEPGSGLSMDKLDLKAYLEQVAPVFARWEDRYYFTTQTTILPFFDVYGYHEAEDDYALIHRVSDEEMLTMCRAEYKYLSTRDKLKMFRLEMDTGVEKELLSCMSTFDAVPYYSPIYAPVFMHEDMLYLFDHPSELLRRYLSSGIAVDSVRITYHDRDRVMGNPFVEVVKDIEEEEFYALFQYPGGRAHLDKIDLESGSTERVFQFTYAYPECVQVKAGEVYYVYRPFESMQKKYLYKEELKEKAIVASQ